MTVEEVKPNIKALENQIKRIKKTDAGKSVCIADLNLYLDIEYLQSFRCLNYTGGSCPWTHFHLYGIAMFQNVHNVKLFI